MVPSDPQSTIQAQICEQFDQAWLSDAEFPRIDDYLDRVKDENRQELLLQLIRLDVRKRRTHSLFSVQRYKPYGEEALREAANELSKTTIDKLLDEFPDGDPASSQPSSNPSNSIRSNSPQPDEPAGE